MLGRADDLRRELPTTTTTTTSTSTSTSTRDQRWSLY
jgi:hypothetical protein